MATRQSHSLIDALRNMTENNLRTQVIIPLLREMGAEYIQDTHGHSEQGKDILFVVEEILGDVLHVCQIKNQPFSGRSNSDNNTIAVLNQLKQCKSLLVPNPKTKTSMLPQAVSLFSTYPIPTKDLANSGQLLTELGDSRCTVIGPEDLHKLLMKHTPDLAAELTGIGLEEDGALQKYVCKHREAHVFGAQSRLIEDFFVNLDLRLLGARSSRIGKRWNLDAIMTRTDHEQATRLLELIKPEYRQLLDMHVVPEGQKSLGIGYVDLANLLDKMQLDANLADVCNIAFVTEKLIEFFGDDIPALSPAASERECLAAAFTLPSVTVGGILDVPDNLCIVGPAGAGKTTLARAIVDAALQRGLHTHYVPCSFIQRVETPLRSALTEFALSLDDNLQEKHVAKSIAKADLIVIDACDEAATFSTTLGSEINALAFKTGGKMETRVKCTKPLVPNIPASLEGAISVSYKKKQEQAVVTIRRSLTNNEYAWLSACNEGTVFSRALATLRTRQAKECPRVIITTRENAELNVQGYWSVMALQPFSDEQLRKFFSRWFSSLNVSIDGILRSLEANPYLQEVCRTPIVATIVASLHENGMELPRSRTEVYDKRFELLLDRWDRMRDVPSRSTVSSRDKLKLLARIAFAMHKQRLQAFSRDHLLSDWNDSFNKVYQGVTVDDLLRELCLCNGVIQRESESTYSFGHLSYQEYLAALGCLYGQYGQFLVQRLHDPWWRHVLVFYAGLAGDVGRLVDAYHEVHGIDETHVVLDDMLKEARFTTPVIRDAISAILQDTVDFDDEEDWQDY